MSGNLELELKFIWIKEFRVLRDFNFNFCHSGEHNFSYEENKIFIQDNSSGPLTFGDKISSITTIAGKNGSGKSTFCEIVLASVATLQNGSLGINYFFNGIVCYGNTIFIQNNISVSNISELENKGYEIVHFEESPFEEMRAEWRSTFVKDGFVYFSNYINKSNIERENNLTNISTNELIQYDFYSSPLNGTYRSRMQSFELYYSGDYYSDYEVFSDQEEFRHLKFILDFPDMVPFIGEHNYVRLYLTYSGNNKYIRINDSEDKTARILEDFERNILSQISSSIASDSQKVITYSPKEHKELIHLLYKLNLLAVVYKEVKEGMDESLIHNFLYQNDIPSFFKKEVKELLDVHVHLLKNGKLEGEYNSDTFQHFYGGTKDWRFFVLENILIPLDQQTKELFKKLIRLEEIVLMSGKHSNCRISNYKIFPNFSSGESSYLALFSRIYDTVIQHKKGYDERSKLILFIDEAEVGFHPEWSKGFLTNK